VENNQLGAPMPHPIEGQEQCSTCHGPDGVRPYPADHAGRPDESCQICHSPGTAADAGTTDAIAAGIPHAVEGKEQCSLCHGDNGSLIPMPAEHIQPVEDGTCTLCHKPVAGAGDVEAPAAKAIPHPVGEDPYTDCTACHGTDKMKPFPASHASFAVDQCTTCHQPATVEPGAAEATATPESGAGTASSGPKAIPHPIDGAAYADCTVCHGAGKLKPFPENHASFAADSCTTCHQPAAAEGTATPEGTSAVTPEATTEATPTVASTPSSESAAPSSGPKPIPHSIVDAAYQECATCHGAGMLKPYPPSHEAFPTSACAGCHQPKVEQ
jgi:mono/diheme cytochrome c family protein